MRFSRKELDPYTAVEDILGKILKEDHIGISRGNL
jgi:hypothetical protein